MFGDLYSVVGPQNSGVLVHLAVWQNHLGTVHKADAWVPSLEIPSLVFAGPELRDFPKLPRWLQWAAKLRSTVTGIQSWWIVFVAIKAPEDHMVTVGVTESENSRKLRVKKTGFRVGGCRGSRRIIINAAPLRALSLRGSWIWSSKGAEGGGRETQTLFKRLAVSVRFITQPVPWFWMKWGLCFWKISSLTVLQGQKRHGKSMVWRFLHRKARHLCRGNGGLHSDDRETRLIFHRLHTSNYVPCLFSFIT